MNTSSYRRHDQRTPIPSASPERGETPEPLRRPDTPGSDSSDSSQVVSAKRSPFAAHLPVFASASQAGTNNNNNNSNSLLPNFSRPSAQFMPSNDPPLRRGGSPLAPPLELQKHRPRQHSQGFFEPSLPTASLFEHSSTMAGLTASQIAAQAAMQHQAAAQHVRKRSQTVPNSQDPLGQEGRRGSKSSPPPIQTNTHGHLPTSEQYHNGLVGTTAAATAANAAFPRSPLLQSAGPPLDHNQEREPKHKASKMKLFSKPKHIGISKDKEFERRDRPLPSPNKTSFQGPSGLSRMVNASTTSVADSVSSNNSSMYLLNNVSTSTMVPAERQTTYEKEKAHKHHFLSRQKLKLKDKDEHHNLPLSSASSNSKPLDPNAPQSLYSFAPSSPGPSTTSFAKSVSGLDLRHGGRALREKKKEEKAASAGTALEHIHSRESEGGSLSEWPSVGSLGLPSAAFLGPSSVNSTSGSVYAGDAVLRETLSGFGLNNMTPDDAWDFLKAKLLVIFEGEDVRIAVEDLNRLVSIHIQRCIQKKIPSVIVEDLRELLHTGFLSLNHTLRNYPDERLVPRLVSMWLSVFGTILPFMQAVFLPLDLEFKGRGAVLTTPAAAAEFWGALPKVGDATLSTPDTSIGDELDVRRIVLLSFRDTVILPRYDMLKATFSRLSLDSINASLGSLNGNSSSSAGVVDRPGTAASLDPGFASYNSQSSTLLDSTPSAGRSRATSNTSAPEVAFQSFSSPPTARPTDPTEVTETVGRMLQCVSVLASVQSGDDSQVKMEGLSKELKHNWLGRGRTGRNRRGFVGTRVRTVHPVQVGGSPTSTPTRAGQRESGEADNGRNMSML